MTTAWRPARLSCATAGVLLACVILDGAAPPAAAQKPVVPAKKDAVPAKTKEKDGAFWLDLDKARAEARKTGKPLFIVFRCER